MVKMNNREKVADLCHKQWAGWMKYLFANVMQLCP